MVEQAQQITGDVLHIVGARVRGGLGLAHTPQIRSNHPETGLRQLGNLPVPTEPEMGEAVAQHHRRALPLLHVMGLDAIDYGVVMSPLGGRHWHVLSLPSRVGYGGFYQFL